MGGANAYLENSPVDASRVTLDADNSSDIDAVIETISVGVGLGVDKSSAIGIGLSSAENRIGFRNVIAREPIDVKAYAKNSSIVAPQGISITADSTADIDATVKTTSVALAGSAGGGATSIAGGGVVTINRIAADIQAYADGASQITTEGASVTVTASDDSSITADGQAVSVTGAFTGGGNATSVSIGLSLALNKIDNDISAYLANIDSLTTGGGDVTVSATDSSDVDADTVAASLAAGLSLGGRSVAVSGGGRGGREHHSDQDERLY